MNHLCFLFDKIEEILAKR